MKTRLLLLWLCLTGTVQFVCAQGTLVYDQESSIDETYPVGGGGIQFWGTVGQSFVPSLSAVEFVRLRLYDIETGNSLGANVIVNLRSDAINGTILGSSPVVSMTNGFRGSVNFVFANPIPVTPGTTYYFETVVQSGDNWGITIIGNTYPPGSFYGGQFPATGNDLWFREGIIVPEPSAMALVFGGGVLTWVMRKRRQRVS